MPARIALRRLTFVNRLSKHKHGRAIQRIVEDAHLFYELIKCCRFKLSAQLDALCR